MFRNRTSKKPDDELYANFRANWGNVVDATSTATTSQSSLDASGDPSTLESQHGSREEIKDWDPTPRAQQQHDAVGFAPSPLDSNSFTFTEFPNQQPGYYTLTHGLNTLYHFQDGDLHTQGMPGMGTGMALGTHPSIPTTDAGIHGGPTMELSPYSHHISQHSFQIYHPFSNASPQHHQPQQHSYPPATFIHQDIGYSSMDHDGSLVPDTRDMGSIDATLQNPSPIVASRPRLEMNTPSPLPPSAEKFRFHVVLNAPTAMIKHADDIPITYLNKGQAYTVSIVDTAPILPLPAGTRYRTFVRISFEDELQRQTPATCWQLWKEGRGTKEAHQRGGKLQAVEYVEPSQTADSDDKRTQVKLDTASFDGFSVIWTPGVNGPTECTLSVRFNFLSTDFSHSKGVKGIPVRFCAKTEALTGGLSRPVPGSAEVAYTKVKLFRDHGAERKLANDIQHVKKTIDKLKRQIAQAEAGAKDFSKRKRQGSLSNPASTRRGGKAQKNKRTWSISSVSSAGGVRILLEEDLHFKLKQQQDMFTRTRPISILSLRGAEQDDPDLHPVALPGEPWDLTKLDARELTNWQHRTTRSSSIADTSSLTSPAPSSVSLHSQAMRKPVVSAPSSQWSEYPSFPGATSQHPSPQITKIPTSDDTGALTGWIEALGVDSTYRPPPARHPRPAACFYILHRDPASASYHRAVYLPQRTLRDLVAAIAAKWNIEIDKLRRVVRVLPRGLEVEMDDDVVREMQEGLDVVMEVVGVVGAVDGVKREWVVGEEGDVVDGEDEGGKSLDGAEGYEIRLIF